MTPPRDMDAAILHGIRDMRPGRIPVPRPRNDEVLLKVKAVGVCGSDLHNFTEGSTTGPAAVQAMVLGHEFAGVITPEIAGQVGLEAGTLVAVDPSVPCGQCEWCHRGHTNLCPNVRFFGYPPQNGAMAEYVAVPRAALHPVPAGFSAADAVLLETLGVALHAIDLAKPKLMETVAVLGCGPVGLLIVQLAKLAGAARVLAVDPLAYRAELAVSLGADTALTDIKALAASTDGRGVDLVLEATDSPDGLDHAAKASRIGGRLVIVGIPEGNRYGLTAAEARRKGLTIKFSRRMPEVYPRAIAIAQQGKVKLAPLATHHFRLADASRAFELQAARRDGVIKAIIEP